MLRQGNALLHSFTVREDCFYHYSFIASGKSISLNLFTLCSIFLLFRGLLIFAFVGNEGGGVFLKSS